MEPTNSGQSPAAGANQAAAAQQKQDEQAFGQLFMQLLQQTLNAAKKDAES